MAGIGDVIFNDIAPQRLFIAVNAFPYDLPIYFVSRNSPKHSFY